ncbi:MAG: hypothetical protein ACKOEP_03085, partial [Phycisphaerales bacterium]
MDDCDGRVLPIAIGRDWVVAGGRAAAGRGGGW